MKLLYKMVHHNKYTKNHRKHSSNKGTQRARYMKKGGATTPVQEDSGSVFKPVTDAISGVTTAMGDSFNSFKQFADSSSEKSKPSPMDISLTEGSNTESTGPVSMESAGPASMESAGPASMESVQPPVQTTETMVDQDENKLDTQISELQEQITNLEVKVSELEDKNSELTDQLADYEELKNLLKKMMGSSTMDNDLGDDTEESSPFGAPMQGDDTEESSPFGAPMNEGTSSFKPSAQEPFDNPDDMSTSPPMSPRNMEQNTEQEDPNKMSL